MLTTKSLIDKFGNPFDDSETFIKEWMIIWDIPQAINDAIPALPNKLYTNKLMPELLETAFNGLISKGLHKEIKTFDGCFNIRRMRGSNNYSRHSWGMAIDMNAFENPFKKVPPGERADYRKKYVKWTEQFLQVWRDSGFSCGADWNTVMDGMHFEPNTISND